MFRYIDKDPSTLNDHANCRQEQEKTLVMEVQKDRDQQWKLVNRLEALEQWIQDREIRIALQEDQIQMLQQEVNELQGKICCCHERPGVTEGPVLTETTESTDGTENILVSEFIRFHLLHVEVLFPTPTHSVIFLLSFFLSRSPNTFRDN